MTGPDAPSYLTLAGSVETEVVVSRSRFLCRMERVGDEAAAQAVVEAARNRHRDARHHCSAFVLGPDPAVRRANDDGEPSGTAGAPMLEVLRGQEVSDVVAVVTRWFGGTLLGAGGLVRAYSDVVRSALDGATLVRRTLWHLVDVTTSHAEAARWENDLRGRGVAVVGTDYAERATLHLAVADPEELVALLAGLTAGTATSRTVGTTWVDRPTD